MLLSETFRNHHGAELAESSLEKRSNLENSKFEHLCLHLTTLFRVNLWRDWGFEWVFSKNFDDLNHLLNGPDHDNFRVVTENHKCNREHKTGEDRGRELKVRLLNSFGVYVYPCIGNQIFTANDGTVMTHVRGKCDELHFFLAPLTVIFVYFKTSTTVCLTPKGVGVIYAVWISKLRDHFNGTHYALLSIVWHVEPQ